MKSTLLNYLKYFGNFSLAFSTLQPDMKYFLHEKGYIAWMKYKNIAYALGDSLSAHKSALINSFIEYCEKENLSPGFCQCSHNTAEILAKRGYFIDHLGVEWIFPISNFGLNGKNKAQLRRWKNKPLKAGVKVSEIHSINKDFASDFKKISDLWLKQKKNTNILRFMARPFNFTLEEDCRCFIAQNKDGSTIAYVIFDPIYQDNKVIGYYSNIDRYLPSAPIGTPVFIRLEAIEKFKDEGKSVFSLGLSPLCPYKSPFNRQSKLFGKYLMNIFFTYGERIYPFKGNFQHKSKWDSPAKNVYFCHKSKFGLSALFYLLKINGAI